MRDLRNRQALVVGASSGVGRAVAAQVVAAGGRAHLVARRAEVLREVAAELGPRATWAAADMTDREGTRRALDTLEVIDHIVVCAVADELQRAAPVAELDPEQVERSFDRVRGYLSVVQAALPLLAERASITLWSGASGIRPPASGFALLAAENASVDGLGRALALELAPVRVNVVTSGVVDTPIHDHDRDDLRAWATASLPARRLGEPDDLADVALFLMGNAYATGQTLVVDGGLTVM